MVRPWSSRTPSRCRIAVNAELARLAHQHPLIAVQLNGDNATYKISDFLSARQFRALELYAVLYSQIGAEDQIAFGLDGPMVIGIAMNRDRRSFSERDRAMMELLRPTSPGPTRGHWSANAPGRCWRRWSRGWPSAAAP